MFRKKPTAEPYDEDLVRDVAGRPVDGHAHTPAYLSPAESYAQLASHAEMITVQAIAKIDAEIPHLDANWRERIERNHEGLRELTVLFPAHTLTAYLRDVAGQPDGEVHTAAVRAAEQVAVATGDARLVQVAGHDRPGAVHEFFSEDATGVSRHVETLVSRTLTAYLDALQPPR